MNNKVDFVDDVETCNHTDLNLKTAISTITLLHLMICYLFTYLFCVLHAGSSQVDDVIAAAITHRTCGVVKPEVEVW